MRLCLRVSEWASQNLLRAIVDRPEEGGDLPHIILASSMCREVARSSTCREQLMKIAAQMRTFRDQIKVEIARLDALEVDPSSPMEEDAESISDGDGGEVITDSDDV